MTRRFTMESERTIELAAERTGLIIVDMQAEGCERHGPGLKAVIKNIRSLLDRFREAGGKIIHIQSVRAKDHPEFTFFGKPLLSSRQQPRRGVCRRIET